MIEKLQRVELRSIFLFAGCLSLGFALGSIVAAGQVSQPTAPRKGAKDVSLPPGARMRIGAPGERLYGALAFSPDSTILAIVGSRAQLWDVATGKHLRDLYPKPAASPPYQNNIHFARDGRTLLGILNSRTLASWDTATGKKFRTIYTAPAGMRISSFVAYSDGRQLVIEIGRTEGVKVEESHLLIHQLQLWDLAQSKLVRSFQTARYSSGWGDGLYFGCLAMSPDGKTVAAADYAGTIVLWDVATGKIIREIPITNQKIGVSAVAFSADSRFLLSTDCMSHGHMSISTREWQTLSLRIRDVATTRERFCISDTGGGYVMSSDGRTLAISNGSSRFSFFELSTGQKLLDFDAKGDHLRNFIFAPDGKTLASSTYDESENGHEDYMLIWDLMPADWHPSADSLTASQLLDLWETLARCDAAKAYRAILTLSAQPTTTIRFFKDRLAPIRTVQPERIHQLVVDLDADEFKKREAASKELARLGPSPETALREALSKSPSSEMRRRAELLLQAIEQWAVKDPDLLRSIRAIWILQKIGTQEARDLLEKLAAGAPAARQTQEAKAAVQFLDRFKKR